MKLLFRDLQKFGSHARETIHHRLPSPVGLKLHRTDSGEQTVTWVVRVKNHWIFWNDPQDPIRISDAEGKLDQWFWFPPGILREFEALPDGWTSVDGLVVDSGDDEYRLRSYRGDEPQRKSLICRTFGPLEQAPSWQQSIPEPPKSWLPVTDLPELSHLVEYPLNLEFLTRASSAEEALEEDDRLEYVQIELDERIEDGKDRILWSATDGFVSVEASATGQFSPTREGEKMHVPLSLLREIQSKDAVSLSMLVSEQDGYRWISDGGPVAIAKAIEPEVEPYDPTCVFALEPESEPRQTIRADSREIVQACKWIEALSMRHDPQKPPRAALRIQEPGIYLSYAAKDAARKQGSTGRRAYIDPSVDENRIRGYYRLDVRHFRRAVRDVGPSVEIVLYDRSQPIIVRSPAGAGRAILHTCQEGNG